MLPGRRPLLTGAILVALAFALLPAGTPPLYDSLPVPDQPYRTLSTGSPVPQGPQPTAARAEVTPADPVINLTTAERRPQAYLLVQTGALQPLAGTARIVASLTPVPLPSPGPHNGVPLGNAYDLELHDQDGRLLEPSPSGQRPVVQLRIPNPSTPGHVVVELHAHSAWTVLKTIRTADVIYAAELPSFGTVVAVYIVASPPTGTPPGRGINPAWTAVAAGLVVVIVVAGLVALGRGRRTPNDTGGGDARG